MSSHCLDNVLDLGELSRKALCWYLCPGLQTLQPTEASPMGTSIPLDQAAPPYFFPTSQPWDFGFQERDPSAPFNPNLAKMSPPLSQQTFSKNILEQGAVKVSLINSRETKVSRVNGEL